MTEFSTDDFDIVKPMATFDEGLESIMKDVMQLPLDNPIALAINEAGATTWIQFMYMDEEDISEITYRDGDRNVKSLTKYEEKLLTWLIGYVRESIDARKPGSDEASFYTQEGFAEYTQGRRKLRRFKARYGADRAEREREKDEKRKSLEEFIVEVCTKVKKTTAEIIEKSKERKQKEKSPEEPAVDPSASASSPPPPPSSVPTPPPRTSVNMAAGEADE